VSINGKGTVIKPTESLSTITHSEPITAVEVDRNYYVLSEALK
jgi:hypothetical protein